MMDQVIKEFTKHGSNGYSVPDERWVEWVDSHGGTSKDFGRVEYYSWWVEGNNFIITTEAMNGSIWKVLPDGSGFICFDPKGRRNNCFLRNAFGEVTHQLTVPWELTGHDVPADADMWFINICEHVDGEFGVSAYVEYAGDFYFELDYHNAKFLWGKPIRI